MISATIRDIAIIIIALETIIIGALLGILIWQVWRLVRLLQNEIKPIIQNTQDTVNTVKGTAIFMSDNIVNPVVKTSSKLIGARRTLQSLTADLVPRRKPSSTKTKMAETETTNQKNQPTSVEAG